MRTIVAVGVLTWLMMACGVMGEEVAGAKGGKQPVVELWNDGSGMAGVKPFLLFAAWEDGRIIRRGEAAKAMGGGKSLNDWASSKLVEGTVKPEEIAALQTAIIMAGFLRPPLMDGLLFPDGPSQSLCVGYGKARRLLRHYGFSDRRLRDYIAGLGQTGSPTREEAEGLADMWDKVARLLDSMASGKTVEAEDQGGLRYPDPFEGTDENGDPSVAYWGLPEYRERVQDPGTARAVVTMTVVQTITPEKYRELRETGRMEREEQHGDWLYFSTSGSVRVPNDTGSMTRITRYKVRRPKVPAAMRGTRIPVLMS